MSEDKTQEFTCTRAEVIKMIDRTCRHEHAQWAVSIRLDARIEGKPDSYFADGCTGWLKLSRSQAKELVKSLLSDYMEQERGARIRIHMNQSQYKGSVPTYWISQ